MDNAKKAPLLSDEHHARGWPKALQIAALVFAVPAVVVGLFAVYITAFPAPCGDFSGITALDLMVSWLIDLPVGLLALGSALFAKSGSARMRGACFTASFITLALPIIGTVAFQYSRCH